MVEYNSRNTGFVSAGVGRLALKMTGLVMTTMNFGIIIGAVAEGARWIMSHAIILAVACSAQLNLGLDVAVNLPHGLKPTTGP